MAFKKRKEKLFSVNFDIRRLQILKKKSTKYPVALESVFFSLSYFSCVYSRALLLHSKTSIIKTLATGFIVSKWERKKKEKEKGSPSKVEFYFRKGNTNFKLIIHVNKLVNNIILNFNSLYKRKEPVFFLQIFSLHSIYIYIYKTHMCGGVINIIYNTEGGSRRVMVNKLDWQTITNEFESY